MLCTSYVLFGLFGFFGLPEVILVEGNY